MTRSELARATPYLVTIPYLESQSKISLDSRFPLVSNEIMIGSDSDCEISLRYLEQKHARVYFQDEKWYLQDLTSTLQIRQNGILVRWFPLESEHPIFLIGPWLFCFFRGDISLQQVWYYQSKLTVSIISSQNIVRI